MARKKEKKSRDTDVAAPKFGGFKPLAGGLEGFKAKLDAEQKIADEREKATAGLANAKAPRAPVARPAPAASAASDLDDDLAFHRMMSGVTPLSATEKNRVSRTTETTPGASRQKAAELQASAAVEAEKALAHLHSLVDDVTRFEVSDDGRRVEGRRVDVSPDLLRSLRHGRLPVDASLDLHGLTAPQAHAKLVDFLRAMRDRRERCVLVIHGKGERVPGAGVLRGEISAWLSQGQGSKLVAAFATARDDDGGEGAVYVALRT